MGTLRLDPVTASITISEAPQLWDRVTEFHQAPSHHIKSQVDIFCEDGTVKGLAQHGLDFDEERPCLANGEHIVMEFQGLYPENPGKTVTWQQYDWQGAPRRSCMCDYCRACRSAGGRFRRPGARLLLKKRNGKRSCGNAPKTTARDGRPTAAAAVTTETRGHNRHRPEMV